MKMIPSCPAMLRRLVLCAACVIATCGTAWAQAPIITTQPHSQTVTAGAANRWSATGALSTARDYHTATLLPNGKVLVVGGYNGSYLSSAELYDPVTGTWTATGALSTARRSHAATLLPNGKVLVAGGWNGSIPLSSAELYDPATGVWTATGALNTARSSHTAHDHQAAGAGQGKGNSKCNASLGSVFRDAGCQPGTRHNLLSLAVVFHSGGAGQAGGWFRDRPRRQAHRHV